MMLTQIVLGMVLAGSATAAFAAPLLALQSWAEAALPGAKPTSL